MKILLLIFVAGLSLATAGPLSSRDISYYDEDGFLDQLKIYAEDPEDFEIYYGDNDVKTELGQKLRKHFEEIMEKIRDIIENGKAYKEDLAQKAKEIRDELKAMGMDISNHAKALISKLKSKAKDVWKKFLDKLHPNKENAPEDFEIYGEIPEDFEIYYIDHNDMKTELGKKLSKHLDEILEKIRYIVDNERAYREDLALKAQEIRDELKAMGFQISNHAKALISKLKTKAKDLWKKFLDRFHPSEDAPEDFEIYYGDEDVRPKTKLEEQLRNYFDILLEKMKDIIENGKTFRDDLVEKMKEIREKLNLIGSDIGTDAKEAIKKLKEKATDYWNKILNKIHMNSDPEDFEIYYIDHNDMQTELGKKLSKHLDEILEKIRYIVDNERAYREDLAQKAREIRDELKAMGFQISNHAKALISKLKTKAKDLWKKFLDRFHPSEDAPEDFEIYYGDDNDMKTALGEKLRKHFEEIMEKIRDIIENGKAYKEDLAQKAKEIRDQLKSLGQDISNHAKALINKLKTKAKDYWKKILDKLHPNKESAPEDFEIYFNEDNYKSPEEIAIYYGEDNDVKTELGKKLRAHFDEIVEKLKDIIENGKAYKEDLVQKAKEIRDKLKEMGMDIGKHAKEVLSKLKSKAKDFWKKVLDKLHPE